MASTFASQAKQVLEQQIALAQSLLNIMRREYDTLRQSGPTELQEFTDNKNKLVAELELVNLSWQTLLKSANVEFTQDGIRKALDKADNDPAKNLSVLWDTLANTAKECQKQNAINGAVITLRSQVTDQALAILRGQSLAETTYDPSGKQQYGSGSNTGGHTIAKA